MARAERRRGEKTAQSTGVAATAAPPDYSAIATEILWWGLLVLIVVLTGRATLHRITWYLAVDQFGYLTFASDLLQGRITHDWSVAKALASILPAQTDMLAQTYIWDAGRMYCRYAPGFPLVLAAWMGMFGKFGVHYLNPTLYLVFIGVYTAVAWRVLGDRWRALVALCLLLLLPTFTHLWALTITRDLCAHLFAWIGLLCVLPREGRSLTPGRVAAAGLALGFCASIRPDDIMYVVPAGLVALHRWRNDGTERAVVGRAIAVGGLTVLLGMVPFFTYNWAATGNPFWPTQGMELQMLMSPANEIQKDAADAPPAPAPKPGETNKTGYPSPGWHGGAHVQVQGGGLRIANLPTTLPGLLNLLNRGYSSAFMGIAVWGLALAIIQRPLLLLTALPYAASAMLLYGCWARPDGRYVLGVHYFMPLLIVEGLFGTFDVLALLGAGAARAASLTMYGAIFAALVQTALALFTPTPVGFEATILPALTNWIVPPIVAAGLLVLAVRPQFPVARFTAMLLALVLTVTLSNQYVTVLSRPSAGFQRPEMEKARATMQSKLPPNSVVITTEDIGRPMENIQYYSEVAQSLYTTDIDRWRLRPQDIVNNLAKAGLETYWLLPPLQSEQQQKYLKIIRGFVNVDKVMDIPKERAMDWFVAAAFHRGVPLELYRLTPKWKLR